MRIDAGAPGPGGRSPARWLAAGLLALACFLLSIQFGLPAAGEHLDISWLMVMGWGHARGAQIGTDLVFTYGPWALVHPWMAHDAAHFHCFVAAMLSFAVLVCAVVLLAARRLPWPALLLLAITIAGFAPVLQADAIWLLALVMVLVIVRDTLDRPATVDPVPALAALFLAGLFMGWLALVKFSLLPATALVWLTGSIALYRCAGARAALVLAVTYPMAVLGFWLGAGQALSGFPAYIGNGWDVAVHYGVTMGLGMGDGVDLFGFTLLLATGLLLCWLLIVERRSLSRSLLVLALGGVVFLAWRAGYTRAGGHIGFFGITVAAASLYLWRFSPAGAHLARLAAGLLALTAVAGHHWHTPITVAETTAEAELRIRRNLDDLADPGRVLERNRVFAEDHRARFDMPRTRARAAGARVDVLGVQQGLAISNDLDYLPRPVFQSYSAYSPGLIRLNEAHFLPRSTAPSLLLVHLQAVDDRLASSEDSLALAATLRAYQPIDLERGFLVMERFADDLPPQAAPVPGDYQPLEFGAWQDVPRFTEGPTLAWIELDTSWIGRLTALLLREPALYVELDTSVGMLTRRLPRSAIASGFVVSPILEASKHLVDLYAGLPGIDVRRFRLAAEREADAGYFAASAQVAFTRVDMGNLQDPQRQATMRGLLYPGFSHAPVNLVADQQHLIDVDGSPALFLHAPALAEFRLPAGAYRMQLQAGLIATIVDEADCAGADGIRVLLVAGHPPEQRVLLEAFINPFAKADPAIQRDLEIAWQQDQADFAAVLIDSYDNGHCDWSWLRNVSISPVPAMGAVPGGPGR
jgi:hypothetical protein